MANPTVQTPQYQAFNGFGQLPAQGGGQTVDPSMWGSLLNAGVGVGGTLLANNQANNGMNGAIGMSQFGPTNVNAGPFGSVSGSTGPNGTLNYNLSPGSAFGPFGALSTASGNYALANGPTTNQFDTAAGGALGAFKNFDPNSFANNEYQQLSALHAPGMTDQTQAMLNYEQASGRGGITQNGQLGDMGGLAFAQNLADTNNKLQATADARNQGNYLAGLATNFQTQANNDRANAMTVGSTGLSNSLSIQQQLQQLLSDSTAASAQRANAGANQGAFRYQGGTAQANATGNLFGGVQQATQPFGGLGGIIQKGYNYFTNGAPSVAGSTAGTFPGAGGGPMADAFSGSGSGVDAANPAWNTGFGNPSATMDATQGFGGASGQAADGMVADGAQTTGGGQVAGWSTTGAGGAGGAGLSGLSAAANGEIGAAAGTSAASDAAAIQAANDAWAAGGATSGAATGGSSGAALGAGLGGLSAVALAAAPVIAGMRSSGVSTDKAYWQGLSDTLKSGNFTGGVNNNSTMNANTTLQQRKSAYDQTIISMLAGGGPQSMGMSAAQRLPPDVMAYAQKNGLVQAAQALRAAGAAPALVARGGGGVTHATKQTSF